MSFLNRFFLKVFSFSIVFFVCGPFILPSAQAGVTIDNSLNGSAVILEGPDFKILSDYGLIKETNLFHSLGEFNIDMAESATFQGPDTIMNIIARITGGTISNIDGLIASEMPNADLYLINPSGFMFGPNASLDVPGSFHVTTADYLALGDEGIFYADPIKTDIFKADPPSAFGFLTADPGDITIQQSRFEVPEGKMISIIGGDIDITGIYDSSATGIAAPAGRIDLASVASSGEVVPDYSMDQPNLNADSFETFGEIKLSSGYVDAGGAGGGTIFIRGGRLQVDNSFIYASVKADSGATDLGKGVDIKISGEIVMNTPYYDGAPSGRRSEIGSNVTIGVNEDSGGVRITADHLEIRNFASIRSASSYGTTGRSGNIEINTNSLLLNYGSYIQGSSGGTTKSGNIFINTGSLDIQDAAYIWTNTFNGSGDGGNIDVTADTITLSNAYPGYLTGIFTQSWYPSTGNSGNINLQTNNFVIGPGTEISTPTYYEGKAGDISIIIQETGSMTGIQGFDTGIFANSFWSGAGGDVFISANQFKMDSNAFIQLAANSVGNAGNFTMADLNTLEITNGSYISATGFFGYGGSAGNISIDSDHILISGYESAPSPFTDDFTGITAIAGEYGGSSGDITIKTTDLQMNNRGLITSTSYGPGQGGLVSIDAQAGEGRIDVLNGSGISASAFGTGDSGRVEIKAGHIKVSGVHPEIYTDGTTGVETISPSGIASQAGVNGGLGGDLYLEASTIEVLDGGLISAATFGSGDSGNIDIHSGHLIVSGVNKDMQQFLIDTGGNPNQAGSDISASSSSSFLGDLATGNAGSIYVDTDSLTLSEGGLITSETTTPGSGGNINIHTRTAGLFSESSIQAGSRVSESAGKAGNIKISVDETFEMDNAYVLTTSQIAAGGDISVQANDINLANQASISAQSQGPGDAGNIYLGGNSTFLMNNSVVSTEALEADGGNIKIFANDLVYLVDSLVSASVGGGSQTSGGNVGIDPEFVILKNSQIIANAFEGQGGNIDIVADVFLADPDSIVDASSQLGIDGQVDIQAPITHISSLVTPLSKDFRSVVALLRQPCMARMQKGEYSSLMIKGRTSLPREPGRFLSSPLSNF